MCISQALWLLRSKLAPRNGRKHPSRAARCATWADNRLLFSRCRCEYSHHWTLSTTFPFVHVHVFLPQLMESVDVAVYFSKKLRICHTFELPSGNWLQHRSAWTSRWHKGSTKQCKLVGRKFEGVSNKSARRLCTRPRTFHLNVTNVHLFTRLDTLKLPLACCAKCQHGNKSVVIVFKHTEKNTGVKTQIHQHSASFLEYFSLPYQL